MLNTEELKKLLLIVTIEVKEKPYLRFGQSFWNNLVINYPEFERTRGTKVDCFHRTDLLPLLIEEVCDEKAVEFFKNMIG